MAGTIVTLGGGGFSMSDDARSAIDDQLLERADRARPRVCFVPTASGDSRDYSARFEAAFSGRAQTSVLQLFGSGERPFTDPRRLLDADVIYVGGGSTANLLAVWRLHGVPGILREALDAGAVLAGISAGANCWFEQSSTDSFGPLAPLRDGLGMIRGSVCPHYRGEVERRSRYLGWVASGEFAAGHAIDDHVALVWQDGALVDAIAERPGRAAFRVDRQDGTAVERALPVRLLAG